MKVGQLKEIIKDMPDTEELCLIFYEKEELNAILSEMSISEATNSQWSSIVERFNNSKAINQIADETFSEMAYTLAYKLGGREHSYEN
jgi:hypothetical protein